MEEVKEGLVDIGAISTELMKSVLGPYVQFDRSRQEFIFPDAWQRLNNDLKLLSYLVGRKGVRAAGHLSDEEATAPKTMIEQTRMPSGSVSYTLKVLSDSNLIAKSESGKYYVPNAKLLVVKGMIEGARKGEGGKTIPKRRGKKGKRTTPREKVDE